MDDLNAFERQLRSEVQRAFVAARPVDVASIVRTAATQSPKWRFQSMFSATKFVVAGVIVALFGGFLLTGFLATQPSEDGAPAAASATATIEPSPVTTPDTDASAALKADQGPYLPAVLPSGTDWGGSGSGIPDGQSRWVHLTGNPKTLPDMFDVFPAPTGVLMFDTGGGVGPCSMIPKRSRVPGGKEGSRCQEGPDLWRSTDALTWEPVTLPVKARSAELTLVDGTYWLATREPTELWRSDDAERWQQVDLSALQPAGPATLQWELELGTPASSDGRTVVPVKYQALDAGRLLGQDDLAFAWPEPTEDPDRYRVKVAYQTRVGEEGDVLVEARDGGLVFQQPDGSFIAALEGVDAGFVEAWSTNAQIAEPGLAVIDEANARPAPLIGDVPPAGPWMARPPAVLGTPDGFRAYLIDGRDGTIATWRSMDGATWAPGDPVALGGAVEFLEIASGVDGARLFAYEGWPGETWSSENGSTWEPWTTPGTYPWGPAEVLFRNDRNVIEISVLDTTEQSGESGESYPLVIPGLTWATETEDAEASRIATIGETIFVWRGLSSNRAGRIDQHDLWVIERWEPTDA